MRLTHCFISSLLIPPHFIYCTSCALLVGCDGFDTSVCGGLNMELFWDIFFWLIPIWIFVFIPFCTFYYEADDGMLMAGTGVASTLKKSKWRQAACAQLIVTIVFGAIFAIAYLVASDTNVPVESYQTASFLMQREIGATYTSTPS